MKVFLRLAAISMLLPCLGSCTLGYARKWQEAAASARTKQPTDLSGAWVGAWQNGTSTAETSHHTGKLWAVATPVKPEAFTRWPYAKGTASPTLYNFRYKATWGKAFQGTFTMEHAVQGKDAAGRYVLKGSRDLGMFGEFRFDGAATPKEFHLNYFSKMNTGSFELKRPG
jgi:hypothetical protein